MTQSLSPSSNLSSPSKDLELQISINEKEATRLTQKLQESREKLRQRDQGPPKDLSEIRENLRVLAETQATQKPNHPDLQAILDLADEVDTLHQTKQRVLGAQDQLLKADQAWRQRVLTENSNQYTGIRDGLTSLQERFNEELRKIRSPGSYS